MKVFVDVEFTAFRDPKMRALGLPYSPQASMLSLGMTLEEGDLELYVEIMDHAAAARASEFVHSHVLSQFGLHPAVEAASSCEAGAAVADYLSRIPGQIELCADYDDDLGFVMEALLESGRLAELGERLVLKNVSATLAVAGADGAWDNAFEALEAQSHLQRHHALLDARVLKRVYQSVAALPLERHGGETGSSRPVGVRRHMRP